MKLTESKLRSIIRRTIREMNMPELGEDSSYEETEKKHISKLSQAIEIATSLQTHLASDETGNRKLGELVGLLHEIEEEESSEL